MSVFIVVEQKYTSQRANEYWKRKRSDRTCKATSRLGHWCFCGFGQEKVWCRASSDKPAGEWDRFARKMIQKFEEATQPTPTFESRSTEDPKSKKDKGTAHCQFTTQTWTKILSALSGTHSLLHVRRSVCLVWSEHEKQRSSSLRSTRIC